MYLFVATHLGSGASLLCESMNLHRVCAWHRGNGSYKHGSDLVKMKDGANWAKVHFDKITHNHQFTCPSLYRQCQFVYVIREPAATFANLIQYKGYLPDRAFLYYTFRLRRLCEMVKKTPKSVVLRADDLFSGRGLETVQKSLGLRDPVPFAYTPEPVPDVDVPHDLVTSAQAVYDRYLSVMLKR